MSIVRNSLFQLLEKRIYIIGYAFGYLNCNSYSLYSYKEKNESISNIDPPIDTEDTKYRLILRLN